MNIEKVSATVEADGNITVKGAVIGEDHVEAWKRAKALAELMHAGPWKEHLERAARGREEYQRRIDVLDSLRRMAQNEEFFEDMLTPIHYELQRLKRSRIQAHNDEVEVQLLALDDPDGVLLTHCGDVHTLKAIARRNNVKAAVHSLKFILDRPEWKTFAETDWDKVDEAKKVIARLMLTAEAEGVRDVRIVRAAVSRLNQLLDTFPMLSKEDVEKSDDEDGDDDGVDIRASAVVRTDTKQNTADPVGTFAYGYFR